MDNLLKQIRVARRRLSLQMFLGCLGWTLLAALSLAALVVGVHARYPTGIDPRIWDAGALAVGLALGLLAAAAWTWHKRPSALATAAEIDRRFDLKERVSSSLALSAEERESEAGQALMADAVARVSRLEIGAAFGLSWRRRMLLPVLPLAGALLLALTVRASERQQPADAASQLAEREQVRRSTDDLRKRVEQRQAQAAEKGLNEAEDLLKQVDQELRQMGKKSGADRKQGLVNLNKLADKLADRRRALGGAEQIKQQLRELKDLKQGPADKLAQAMKKGDLAQAAAELEKLQQQLGDGKLDAGARAKLAEQLQQMQQKLSEQAQQQREKMEDLKRRLEQARQQGNGVAADQLQRQIDQLQRQSPQRDRLQKMANQLGHAAQAAKQGNARQAQQALNNVSRQLSQAQQEMDQLETLDRTLDDIQLAKNSMTCDKCGGKEADACRGAGADGKNQGQAERAVAHDKLSQPPGGQGGRGFGRGRGFGQGERPIAENPAGAFDTRVRQKVGPGESVITGTADGPNAKGRVREAIKAEFESQDTGPADPLTGQRLPKSQRTHVEEYFDSLRTGN